MNRQCHLEIFKRITEPSDNRSRKGVCRLSATHINKGKPYPYMPAPARAAMIKSELEKQARGTSG